MGCRTDLVPMNKHILTEISKSRQVLDLLEADTATHQILTDLAQACAAGLQSGRKILFAGNGGSAADAQHLAAELVGRFAGDRPALPAIALTADTAVLTALGNDYGYERVFSRQVSALGSPGDVLFGISTSGRSPSILLALQEGRGRGLITAGFTGREGGDMPTLCDYLIRIPSDETARIQEGHIVIGHILCGMIECALFGRTEGEPRRSC